MNPENRLAEAQKQLRIAAADEDVSETQSRAITGVLTIVEELERSIQRQRDDEIVTDGGQDLVLVYGARDRPSRREDVPYHRSEDCTRFGARENYQEVLLEDIDNRPCRCCAAGDIEDAELVEACPECDSLQIQKIKNKGFHSVTVDHDYYCHGSRCNAKFDEPKLRPRKATGTGRSGLAGKLERMDPDELGNGAGKPMTDGGVETPLDRIFVEDADDRPDEIVVEELTTMDAEEFIDRLESLADAADAINTMAEDLQRLRQTGLTDDDALHLIYGRNRSLAKQDISAMFKAIDELVAGRADRPTERILSDISDLNLSETAEVMDELDRLNRRYGGNNA